MRRLLLAVAVVLALAGCGTAGSPAATVQPVTPPSAAPVAEPVSVTISKLKVTDEVVPVGLCAKKAPPRCEFGKGELELPDVSETGWYRLAPRPGQLGRAVLASHVDWDGTPGAFKHLGTLTSGDLVVVKDAGGVERTFVVYDVKQIEKADYQADTVPLVFGPSTGAELALVTCGGKIRGRSYDSNVIVRARAT